MKNSANNTIWDVLHFDELMGMCKNCGQAVSYPQEECEMCDRNRNGALLSVCRNLIIGNGKRKATPSDDPNTDVRELSLEYCIAEFPFELAVLTNRFEVILASAGVWFSHMVAYLNTLHIQAKAYIDLNEVLNDPSYLVVREQVYRYLQDGFELEDTDTQEMVESLYFIPGSRRDPYHVIEAMIQQLEEEEKIVIEWPQSRCMGCGKEIRVGTRYCEECRQDDQIASREAIMKKGLSLLKKKSSETQETGNSFSGMHFRRSS